MGDKTGNVNIIIKAKDKTGGAMSSAAKGFQGLGKAAVLGVGVAAAAVTAAVVGIGVKSAMAFVAFEDQMNEVFTLLPGISEQAMGEMRDDVLETAREMGRLPEEIIPALYQSLSAGVPPENVFDFLDTAHEAALGGVTDLETAVDGISSVVNAYGSDVITATEASDLMFTAVRLGKTDFGQLSANISQVTPLTAAMGIGVADVTAALAAMTAQGTPTNQATTQLRALFTELGDSGSQVGQIFEEVAGVSFLEFIEAGGNTAEALAMLEEHAIATDVPLQDMFSSVRSGIAALQLTGSGMEVFEGNLDEMANSAGATEAAYEVMNSGMARGFEIMKATVATIMIDIGEALAPVVVWLSDKLLGAFEDLQPYIDFVVQELGDFFETLTSGGDPLNAVTDLMDSLLRLFGASDGDIQTFRSAIDDTVAAFETAKQIFGEVKDKVLEFLEPLFQIITEFVSWKDVAMALGLSIASFILPILGGLVVSLASILAPVLVVIGIIALLRNAWENDWGGIRTKLTEVWEGTIQPALILLREWLEINIPIAIQKLKEFWENVLLPAIIKVWEWISGTLIPFFQNTVIPFLQEKITAALQTLADFWENTLQPAIQRVWEWIQGTLIPFFQNTVIPFLQEKIPEAIQTLTDFWETVLLPALENIWGFIQDSIIPLFEALVELLKVTLAKAIEALTGLWENVLLPALTIVWEFIQDNIIPILTSLWEWFKEKITPVIQTLVDGALALLIKAWETISGAVEKVIGWIHDFTDLIGSIKLPWWLTPGSPTPFELGLIGISGALRLVNKEMLELNNLQLEASLITNRLKGSSQFDSQFGRVSERGAKVVNNFNMVVNTGASEATVTADFDMMRSIAAGF